MIRRLATIHRHQRGLTLVELVIAIALFGILAGSITMAFSHVFIHSALASARMTAVRQAQSAGYWVSQDTLQARHIDVSGPYFSMSIPYREGEGTLSEEKIREVDYDVIDGRLLRKISYPDDPDRAPVETMVAEHITDVELTESDGVYIFRVSASTPLRHGEGSEPVVTREYTIDPRPGP